MAYPVTQENEAICHGSEVGSSVWNIITLLRRTRVVIEVCMRVSYSYVARPGIVLPSLQGELNPTNVARTKICECKLMSNLRLVRLLRTRCLTRATKYLHLSSTSKLSQQLVRRFLSSPLFNLFLGWETFLIAYRVIP